MTRRVVIESSIFLSAFLGVTAVSALLGRAPKQPEVAQSRAPRPPAPIEGRAAAAGDVRETTLHRAHLRGGEPVPCSACHTIEEDGFTVPDRERCVACHPARDAALHAKVADESVRRCTSCHDFLDGRPTRERAWQCARCHEHPHPDGAVAAGSSAETCGRCHAVHGEKSRAQPSCLGCHEDRRTRHLTDAADPGTTSCLACHGRHDPARLAQERCAPCHRANEPLVPATATFAGHDRCTGCHLPHTFARDTVRPCASCHQHQETLASSRVADHRDCKSCHDQHAVKVATSDSCLRCHDRPDLAHRRMDRGADCIGCHPPHPGRGAAALTRVACSSCHRKAGDDRAFHRGARCTDCHKQHRFRLAFGAALCLGCHAGGIGRTPAIRVSTGHGECGNCHGHDPHAPAAPPACGTCHGEQASTAPAGHARCTACHDQHRGSLLPRVASCTGCHADRARGPHAAIDGGCARCHRPHGPGGNPAPPPCATCHDRSALPFMHRIAGHATCGTCHRSHSPPRADRATCLACHTDRRDHEPTAASCSGCHPFSRGAR